MSLSLATLTHSHNIISATYRKKKPIIIPIKSQYGENKINNKASYNASEANQKIQG